MVPSGTRLLGELVDVDVDRRTLAAGHEPILEPAGPEPAAWRAYAAMLRSRVAEVEAENAELRAGALHPTARHLLDLWLRQLRAAGPASRSIEHVAAAPSADFWHEMESTGRSRRRPWSSRQARRRPAALTDQDR